MAARAARRVHLERAWTTYRAALERMVLLDRVSNFAGSDIPDEMREREEKRRTAFLSEDEGVCLVAVQPLYPTPTLIDLRQLRQDMDVLRVGTNEEFPAREVETIPDGFLFLETKSWAGSRNCQQICANGLVHGVHDCAYVSDDKRILPLWTIAERLVLVLRATCNLLRKIDFAKDVVVTVALTGTQECAVPPLLARSGYGFVRTLPMSLLPSYEWERTLGVTIWQEEQALQEFAIDFIRDICWGLGQGGTEREQIEKSLQQVSLLLK